MKLPFLAAHRLLVSEFVRFCTVGVLNTSLNLAVFWALVRWSGLPVLVSGAIGFISGAISGYVLNRIWTFKSENPAIAAEGLMYLSVQVFSLGCHSTTQFLVRRYGDLGPIPSQLCGIAVSTVVNFGLSRTVVFRRTARRAALGRGTPDRAPLPGSEQPS